jgi:hypothetical protein
MTIHSRVLVAVLMALSSAYVVAAWPALSNAWWYCDDYARIVNLESSFVRACQNGRPLESLWMATLQIDSSAGAWAHNIALRAAQAATHVGVAMFGGLWLALVLRERSVIWVAALFLLWPLNAEAVLWRTAGSYPIGALLGVFAIWLAWPPAGHPKAGRLFAAAALVMAAALTNQTSSMIVWLLPCIAILGGAKELRCDRRVGFLLAAHVLAAVLSVLITHLPEFATARATFSDDPLKKVRVLGRVLTRVWFWRSVFPLPVIIGHGLLLVSVMLSIELFGASLRKVTAWVGGIASLSVIPFVPILVVGENYAPARVMYLGPWLIVAAWILVCRQRHVGPRIVKVLRRWMALTGIAAAAIGYVAVGRGVTREYVDLFQVEQGVLERADRIAMEYGTSRVAVEAVTPETIRNPLGHLVARDSGLQVPYAVPGRVARFSRLTLVPLDPIAEAADNAGVHKPRSGFDVVFDRRIQCVLILQPR